MTKIFSITGKMSHFGGPNDTGVAANEGLALVQPCDLSDWWFSHLFIDAQPPGTTGLARRLNPNAHYVACRWDYSATPAHVLRRAIARLTNSSGIVAWAQCADWGPNEDTGRVADLSDGLCKYLDLDTDDVVTVEVFI